MVHTLPDYTTSYKKIKIYGEVDNAELAARLGALSLFDRRGNVLYYDDFENDTTRYSLLTGGGAGTVAVSTDRCYTGSSCLKMVTAASSGTSIGIEKRFLPAYDSRVGFECMFHPVDDELTLTILIWGYTGTKRYQGWVKYHVDTNTVEYQGSGGGWVTLGTDIHKPTLNEAWIPIKMCLDNNTAEYIRILIGNNTYNLTGQGLVTTANGANPYMYCKIICPPDDNVVRTSYIDNFIVTQNEV